MKSHLFQHIFPNTRLLLIGGIGVVILLVLPMVAFAAPATFRAFADLIVSIVNNALIPLIFALAFIVFIWGVFKYFFFPTEDNKKRGRDYIVWGLVGMFVMVSVWGLVNIVLNTFFSSGSCISDPNLWGCYGP